MDTSELIRKRVKEYFVTGENNCAMTVVRILAEIFEIPLEDQTLAAANCMPAAGGTGGLCGLVTGGLMFTGIWGRHYGIHRQYLKPISHGLTGDVQEQFKSIDCRDLEAYGCDKLAVDMLEYVVPRMRKRMEEVKGK